MQNKKTDLNSKTIPDSPLELAEEVSGGRWRRAPHLELINRALKDAASGKMRKLIINMPPRHGKSEFISKYFPFWYLLKNPDKRIILCSYNNRFASSWGRKVKELIISHGEKYGISLNRNSRSNDSFDIEGHAGGMDCAGAGGAITGKGANIIIIDDPVKNQKEAKSQNKRDDVWEWFKATAYTRLEPEGSILIVMTRWDRDDICGKILNALEGWERISLPAIAIKDEPGFRKEGEALWKERVSLEELLERKATISEYWFAAQYQQEPMESGEFCFKSKNFRYFYEENGEYCLMNGDGIVYLKIPMKDARVICAVDPAVATEESSDYTAAAVAAITPGNQALILEVIRRKVPMFELMKLLEEIKEKYNPVVIGIETVGTSKMLLQEALRLNLPAFELKAEGNKSLRSALISAKVEGHAVFFRQNAPWLDDFLSELKAFPNGKHDDQADAFAYIGIMMSKGFSGGAHIVGVRAMRMAIKH